MKGPKDTGKRRTNHGRWKHVYGVDRKYTARVDRVKARAEDRPA